LLSEWEEAVAEWQAALDRDLAAGDRHDAVANARWLADALLTLGEDRRAADVLQQGLEIAVSAPQVPSEIWLRARLAGLAATGRDQAAAHLARCDEVMATGDEWRGLVGEVALARAAVAVRDHEWSAAAAAAQEAVTVFGAYRLPWLEVTALQAWARALTGSGLHDEADARRDAAAQLLDTIGAPERWRTHHAWWRPEPGPASTRSQRAHTTLEP
jgi:hypothetical protein